MWKPGSTSPAANAVRRALAGKFPPARARWAPRSRQNPSSPPAPDHARTFPPAPATIPSPALITLRQKHAFTFEVDIINQRVASLRAARDALKLFRTYRAHQRARRPAFSAMHLAASRRGSPPEDRSCRRKSSAVASSFGPIPPREIPLANSRGKRRYPAQAIAPAILLRAVPHSGQT